MGIGQRCGQRDVGVRIGVGDVFLAIRVRRNRVLRTLRDEDGGVLHSPEDQRQAAALGPRAVDGVAVCVDAPLVRAVDSGQRQGQRGVLDRNRRDRDTFGTLIDAVERRAEASVAGLP